MNRHMRIFLGVFCWMTCVSFVALAVINGAATPPQSAGVAIFAGLAIATAIAGYLLIRQPRAV